MYSEFTAGNAENYLRLLTALSHINVRVLPRGARGAAASLTRRTTTRGNGLSRKLGELAGIGALTATALTATVAHAAQFKNGRQCAAWLGLTPRQDSTGGKNRLLGITKRGDVYLRTLLVHGARSIMRHSAKRDDPKSRWVEQLRRRRGTTSPPVHSPPSTPASSGRSWCKSKPRSSSSQSLTPMPGTPDNNAGRNCRQRDEDRAAALDLSHH